MNILLIGTYRQADGWGQATRDFIKALMAAGHNVYLTPIFLGASVSSSIPKELADLEHRKLPKYDAVIQFVLPQFLYYNKDFGLNIGFSFFETKKIEMTGWVRNINLMDAYFVSSTQEKLNLIASGVTIPIYVIGPTTNVSKYEESYDFLPGLESNTYKFYFIGEHSERKNLHALVKAFHLEFNRTDNVDLVIKVNKPGLNSQELFSLIDGELGAIKQSLKLYYNLNDYKKEICIVEDLPENLLAQLHSSCDCFVMPSRGEAICRPALDAMGFGNPCIVTGETGMTEFVNNQNGWIVPSQEQTVIHSANVMQGLYTSYERWQEIDIDKLRIAMRRAYKSAQTVKSTQCLQDIYKYSYEETGKRINEVLCQL